MVRGINVHSLLSLIKSRFALFSALLLTIITRVKANSCAIEHFQNCTGTLETLTDKGLTFGATKADLEAICPDLRKAIRCIHHYTRTCWSLERHKHFQKMFKGTGHMVHDLCRNGTYQEEYLKYAPCMKTAAADNEVCVRRYSSAVKNLPFDDEVITPQTIITKRRRDIADERLRSLCCGFQEYMQCTTLTMTRSCGADAGRFSKGFLYKMSSIMLEDYCTAYRPAECGILSSSAPRASSTISAYYGLMLLTLPMLMWS